MTFSLRRLLGWDASERPPHPPEPGWPAGHFYSPLPDLADIREREASIFGPAQPSLPGLVIDADRQLSLLDRLAEFYPEQPFGEHRQPGLRYYFDNPNFRHGEALVLYGMIRHLQPKRIIEIGSGYSSCLMLDTNERFFGGSIDCTFIEPYPRQLQELLRSDDRGRIRLLERKVYDVELAEFERLEPGDILFVDSSHVAKVGSDVNDIFFRILPGLRPGVTIHFHDILHNFEYPPKWVFEGRAWNEAYLLRAFLQFNPVFTVEFFNSWLWQFRRDRFAERLPLVQLGPGSSIWLRKGPGGIFSS